MTVRTRPAETQPPGLVGANQDRPRSAVRAWTVRHPLTAFLIILFGLAYPLMAVPVLTARGAIPGAGSSPACRFPRTSSPACC